MNHGIIWIINYMYFMKLMLYKIKNEINSTIADQMIDIWNEILINI